AEVVALDRALEALADADPGDLDRVTRLERLDGHRLAFHRAVQPAAELDQLAVRRDAVLGQMAELGLGELALDDLVERELHRLVAVGVGGLHLHHRAWSGRDHGDGRDDAGLRVEDLRHTELFAQDALSHSSPPPRWAKR